jgi:hypothetical protein
MPIYYIRRLVIRGIFCHVFEIEPVQVSEPAVPAPYRDVAATDGNIMKPIDTTVPADSRSRKRPDRPWPGFYKYTLYIYILIEGYKNTGSPAESTGNVSPVGHDVDMLIGHLSAVVTVGMVICADEFVIHAGVLCIRGIINLSQPEISRK